MLIVYVSPCRMHPSMWIRDSFQQGPAKPQHTMVSFESNFQCPPRTIPTLGIRTTLVWIFLWGFGQDGIYSQIHCFFCTCSNITIFRHAVFRAQHFGLGCGSPAVHLRCFPLTAPGPFKHGVKLNPVLVSDYEPT